MWEEWFAPRTQYANIEMVEVKEGPPMKARIAQWSSEYVEDLEEYYYELMTAPPALGI